MGAKWRGVYIKPSLTEKHKMDRLIYIKKWLITRDGPSRIKFKPMWTGTGVEVELEKNIYTKLTELL